VSKLSSQEATKMKLKLDTPHPFPPQRGRVRVGGGLFAC